MRRYVWFPALAAASGLLSACGDDSNKGDKTATAGAAGSQSTGTSGSASTTGGSSSGGASTTGGSAPGGGDDGAAGGIALPPVGSCDALPAPGTWENVTPKGDQSKAVNGTPGAGIIADPLEPGRVWLGTSGSAPIFRSDDCGATWTKVNTGSGGDEVADGVQWSMQADPEVAGTMYVTSGYGAQGLWKTTDGGENWTDVLVGSEYAMVAEYRFVNNVSLDPANRQHLVVSTHGACAAPYAPYCIGESKDGGKTWTTLKAPEPWIEGGGLIIVKDGLWVWCGSELMVTPDGGKTWNKGALEGGGSCEAQYTIRSFVPASDGNYYLGGRAGVITSKDGLKWTHVPNTSGLLVMLTQGSADLFVSNQWQPSIKTAKLAAVDAWTDLPTPPQIAEGTDGGIPFMAFDDKHRILYASLFTGGVARMVVP